jgi:ATP-dependent Clp protease ATP-binding subunit ClpC
MFGSIFNNKKGKDQPGDIQNQGQSPNQQAYPGEQPPQQGQFNQPVDPQQNQINQSDMNSPQNQPAGQIGQPDSTNTMSNSSNGDVNQSVQSGQMQPGADSQTPQDSQTGQTGAVNEQQSQDQTINQPSPANHPDMSALTHLDPRATQVLTHAQEETKRIKQQFIEPEQLLFGLLYDENIYRLLGEFSVDGGEISKQIQSQEKMGTYKGMPTLSKTSQQVFDQAYRDAKMRGSNFVIPEDLFVILFNTNLPTAQYLQSRGLKKEAVVEKLSKNGNVEYAHKTILEKYGIDLTEEARAGRLDPMAGRDKEIDRVVHILVRRTKNNPIIIGEPGVGKTAIVEGLAQLIVANKVPKDLQDKRIFQLDVASLVAGASHRGEFEERLRGVINEVLGANNKIILFIDEIHTLMADSGDSASGGAANIIKPHLARGHFQLIGATTTTEYRKNFEKDKAFERRFQPVTAEEPSEENAFEMLKVLRPKYEKFHKVTIPDDALKECIKLSKKYIGERYLPDKAIDLLDEACSEVKLQLDAGKRGDNQTKKADIEKVVSAWTGIPITKLTEDESEKLLRLEDRIHKRLVDQEEAVVAVSEAVRRGRIGLASAQRPIASFVFLGPTGVGKTELAKTLAELLFGRDDAMARLDMSEYMEKHEVAKLIGAPPGYVGYEEGGQLTEAVRKKPYSIVLMDEIEKAHPDVFNILLQLLEDGRLTDNRGNTISFKNTIVICTSNIGSATIQKQLSAADPTVKHSPEERARMFKQLNGAVREELIKFFRPELLNRFDEVVIFKPLQPEHMAGIARLGIAKTAALLKEQGFNLQITEKAIAKLAKDGYDPVYGARPLRRLIQTAIENPIALAIISKKFVQGDTIVIDYNDDTNEFVFNKGTGAAAGVALNAEQFKVFLMKLATPDTIADEQEKLQYSQLHEKIVKASVGGNKTATAMLSVTAATSKPEIELIRTQLEEAKKQGDTLAKEILELAATVAVKVQATANLKKTLLLLVSPSLITSPEKREKFTQLHDRLVKESTEINNQLATTILGVTEATPDAAIEKLMTDLTKGKEQEDDLSMSILALVNAEIADAAEQEHAAQPATKFKKTLQQIINPLYTAAPENKQKFSQLYDKIYQASQQNHPIAASILAITDITSDDDIAQLQSQLEQAQKQGDPLAAEILATIAGAEVHDDLQKLKRTLLFVVNPLIAPTPMARETFTAINGKVTQAGQKGDQMATEILAVTDKSTDEELTSLQQQFEKAKANNNEIALMIADAMTNMQDLLVNNQGTSVTSDQPTTQQSAANNVTGQQSQPVQNTPDPNYPFGMGDQRIAGQTNGIDSTLSNGQNMNGGFSQPMQNSGQPTVQNQPMMTQQQGYYPPTQYQPMQQPMPNGMDQNQGGMLQQPFTNQPEGTGQPMNPIASSGAAMQPSNNS